MYRYSRKIVRIGLATFPLWSASTSIAQLSSPIIAVEPTEFAVVGEENPALASNPEQIVAESTSVPKMVPTRAFYPSWIWAQDATLKDIEIFQAFTIAADPQEAELQIAVDNEYQAFVNDVLLSSGNDWTKPARVPLVLGKGENTLRIVCKNTGGAAGAIAAILLRGNQGVSVVGTSATSTVFSDGVQVSSTSWDSASAPWNLVKKESQRDKIVRAEAHRLFSEAHGTDNVLAAKSILYLAYLGIEFPNVEYESPTFSMFDPEPELPMLAQSTGIVRSFLRSNDQGKRVAALNGLKYILENADGTHDLLEYYRPDFEELYFGREDVQLTVLDAVRLRLILDAGDFDKIVAQIAKAKTDIENTHKGINDTNFAIEAAKEERNKLKGKSKELNDLKKSIEKNLEGQKMKLKALEDLPMPTDLQKEEIEAFRASIIILDSAITDTGGRIKTNDIAIVLADAKITKLGIQLSDLTAARKKLENELESLKQSTVSGSAFARISTVEDFIIRTRPHFASNIVTSFAASVLDGARKLRMKYAYISAYDDADNATATSTGSVLIMESGYGARVSAADIPLERFLSGDRPGVANTAPFDATATGRSRSPYPLTDDKGRRIKRDISKNGESKVEKAPGGSGAIRVNLD